MQFRFLLIILLFAINLPAYSTLVFSDNCSRSYQYITSLRFGEAKELIAKERVENPSNNIPVLLESMVDFLTAFISETPSAFEQFNARTSKRLDLLDQESRASPCYLYSLAEIHLQSALVRLKFREYYYAANDLRKAYKLLQKNKKLFPAFVPNQKGLAILHLIIGSVPNEYKWATSIIGMEGSITGGLHELESLYNITKSQYTFLHDESLFLLTFAVLNFGEDGDVIMQMPARYTPQQIKENPLMCFAKANLLYRTGNAAEALDVLAAHQPDARRYPFLYLEYFTGLVKLSSLDNNADVHFKKYVSLFQGKNYIRSAYQKLAWHCLIRGDKEGYQTYIRYCAVTGNDFVDEDKQALKEAKSAQLPNTILLKARLLSDGGYYRRAVTELSGKSVKDFPLLRDQLELSYRLARIFHKTNEISKAIEYYTHTIAKGEKYPYYFASNSALQLGLLYEKQRDYSRAAFYFQKCLSMRNHEYQTSIDQKAESGLDRVKK